VILADLAGRHLAAWAGVTPKEHSTGGKQRMGGISRAGNVCCLYARAVTRLTLPAIWTAPEPPLKRRIGSDGFLRV
jgi:transposase